MTTPDRNAARPPLDPADIYRPRLGAQKEPLSKTTMSELRAWREVSAQTASAGRPEQTA